jgi:hypothetical protein
VQTSQTVGKILHITTIIGVAWMLAIFAFRRNPKSKTRMLLKYTGVHLYLLDEVWRRMNFDHEGIGFKTTSFSIEQIYKILYRSKSIKSFLVINITEPRNITPCAVIISSCNEICRLVSGVDIGLTITPSGLYKKLVKYDGERNYRIVRRMER